MSDLEVLTCCFCKKLFQNKKTIIWHMLNVHKETSTVQTIIQEIYSQKQRNFSLKNATAAKNGRKKKEIRKYSKEFNCETCGYVTIYMSTFKRHVLSHSQDNRIHKCNYCSYAAVQPYNLQKHLKNVHPFGYVEPVLVLQTEGKLIERDGQG